MTVKIYKNGVEVSNAIKFVNMSPWTSTIKQTEHQIDGANFDIVNYRGRNSPTTTITGYCQRSEDNMEILEGLKDGSVLTIVHSLEGTKTGYCLSLVPVASGTFVQFSMTVKNQVAL